jgi:hypothetical protein
MNAKSEQNAPVDVMHLIWAMLDEQISEDDFQRLDQLLRDDEDARRVYLQCVQMHLDLTQYFASKDRTSAAGPIGLPISVSLPVSDAAADPAL